MLTGAAAGQGAPLPSSWTRRLSARRVHIEYHAREVHGAHVSEHEEAAVSQTSKAVVVAEMSEKVIEVCPARASGPLLRLYSRKTVPTARWRGVRSFRKQH